MGILSQIAGNVAGKVIGMVVMGGLAALISLALIGPRLPEGSQLKEIAQALSLIQKKETVSMGGSNSGSGRKVETALGHPADDIDAYIAEAEPVLIENAKINETRPEHRILIDGSVVLDPTEIARIRAMAIPKETQDKILDKYYRTGYLPSLKASSKASPEKDREPASSRKKEN